MNLYKWPFISNLPQGRVGHGLRKILVRIKHYFLAPFWFNVLHLYKFIYITEAFLTKISSSPPGYMPVVTLAELGWWTYSQFAYTLFSIFSLFCFVCFWLCTSTFINVWTTLVLILKYIYAHSFGLLGGEGGSLNIFSTQSCLTSPSLQFTGALLPSFILQTLNGPGV